MEEIKKFVCNEIEKDESLYASFEDWLIKKDMNITFVLEEDNNSERVLKIINKFFEDINFNALKNSLVPSHRF